MFNSPDCYEDDLQYEEDDAYDEDFIRAEREDDDGYDPYSDRTQAAPLFEPDPWK